MIRVCPQCGQKNRVGAAHLHQEARCGSCKASIPPMAEPIDADGEIFDDLLENARVPLLVDFWAEWCPPCKRAGPEVKQTASAVAGRALVVKVDTDRHPEIAARYQVTGIPNFVVLKDGRVVSQQAGLVGHAQMTRWLDAAAA